MDQEARLRRREAARRATVRRRRLTLVGVLIGVAVVVLAVTSAGSILGGGDGDGGSAGAEEEAPPPELPGGGRKVFPDRRVVAYYGAPQDKQLGALGMGSPEQVARRLRRQARPYARPGRPVLPAFELISTVVQADPGEDGDHAFRQTPRTIRGYLRAARREHMLLILDIQPGYAAFMKEVRALRPYLLEPDVSLALDPEWSLQPPALPGQEIGWTDASTVNRVSAYLSRLVRRHRLPEKLLVLHRFTTDMIQNERALETRPGVALTVNVDGFGDRPNKISKYHQLTDRRRGRHHGFKLFYEEDTNLMGPKQVLRLRPAPDLIVYE